MNIGEKETKIKSYKDFGSLTVRFRVTVTNEFRLRNWIMQQLIILAGKVAKMDVDIKIVEDE